MSFWDKLEEVRQKPKAVRDAYAFWLSFGVVSLIVLVWLSSFPARVQIFSTILSPQTPTISTSTKATEAKPVPPPTTLSLHNQKVDSAEAVTAKKLDLSQFMATALLGWQRLWTIFSTNDTPPIQPEAATAEPVWQTQPISNHASGSAEEIIIATSSLTSSSTVASETANVLQ